jgi:hypothetical protein
MKRPTPSSVRIVGRRIYVDFSASDGVMSLTTAQPPIAAARAERAKPSLVQQERQSTGLAYRQAVTGAASRFEEIQPFLVSATTAAAPNPAVLTAVAQAVADVQQSLRVLQTSREGGPPLQLLVSAASLAAESVSAGFQGDRASKAKQSLAVFAAAKAQLQ